MIPEVLDAVQGLGAGGCVLLFWLWREERKERQAAQATITRTLNNTPRVADELGDLVDEIRELNGKRPKTRKSFGVTAP